MTRSFQKIVDITEGQWGLITRAQARNAGVPAATFARLLDRGLLERIAHGVYRVRGSGEPDHVQLRAAWLQLDPRRTAWERLEDPDVAVVSHVSAASLYSVGELRPDIHEFTSPVRRQTRRRDVRLHRGRVSPSEQTVLNGMPVTRAARMIADLLSDHVEPVALARITAEVIESRHDYPQLVADKIAPFAASFGLGHGDGVALLEHLLELGGGRLNRGAVVA